MGDSIEDGEANVSREVAEAKDEVIIEEAAPVGPSEETVERPLKRRYRGRIPNPAKEYQQELE